MDSALEGELRTFGKMATTRNGIVARHRSSRQCCSPNSLRTVPSANHKWMWGIHWWQYTNIVHGSLRQRTRLRWSRRRGGFWSGTTWTLRGIVGHSGGRTVCFRRLARQSTENRVNLSTTGRRRRRVGNTIWQERKKACSYDKQAFTAHSRKSYQLSCAEEVFITLTILCGMDFLAAEGFITSWGRHTTYLIWPTRCINAWRHLCAVAKTV